MAKYVGYKRPKNTKKAMKNLLRYLGYHKWLLLLVAVLVAISSGVSIAGTYLIRPVINDYAIPGDIPGLIRMMIAMGILSVSKSSGSAWKTCRLMLPVLYRHRL